MADLEDAFNEQMASAQADALMKPGFRKRRLIMWFVRLALACILAWFFWEHRWVRIFFWIYVVFAAIGLASMLLMPYVLKKKMEQMRAKFEEAQQAFGGAEETEDGEATIIE